MVSLELYDSILGRVADQRALVACVLKLEFDYDVEANEGYDPAFFGVSSQSRRILEKWSEHSLRLLEKAFDKALRDGSGSTLIEFPAEEVELYMLRRTPEEFDVRVVIRDFVTVGTVLAIGGLVCAAADLAEVAARLRELVRQQSQRERPN
jgi:hypothetical protein